MTFFFERAFSTINEDQIRGLVERRAVEGRHLDFKKTLSLSTGDSIVEFLRDVVAFANADGGVLVFGIREGEGDDAGVAIAIEAIAGSWEQISTQIDGYLRTNIDERIPGVQHRAVDLTHGGFVYLVRVPASPLAPHMIADIRTSRPRFYARATTSNDPMTASQIKDLARRSEGAMERAAKLVEQRVALLKSQGKNRKAYYSNEPQAPNQAVLHIVPLYAAPDPWHFGEPAAQQRLTEVRPFGYSGHYEKPRFTQHGAFAILDGVRHVAFLRKGVLEFQYYDVLRPSSVHLNSKEFVFIGSEFAVGLDCALEDAARLSADGYLSIPAVVQLHLLDVTDSFMQMTADWSTLSRTRLTDVDVATESFVVSDWSERNTLLRNLLDQVWQAWGSPACPLFGDDGTLRRFDPSSGRPLTRR